MGTTRDEIANTLWNGTEPFLERSTYRGRTDYQGWASDNPMLHRAVAEIRPRIIVEIGVWKGGSTITLAEQLRAHGLNGVVIAVDTWLGSQEHWYVKEWFDSLRLEAGYPTLFKTFCANVIAKGLDDLVVPLPMDSLNAAGLLKHHGIQPDVVHIDAGHDYASVMSDLKAWWPLVKPGGVLIGDDYHPVADAWPEVRAAFQDFFQTTEIDNYGGKCLIKKAGPPRPPPGQEHFDCIPATGTDVGCEPIFLIFPSPETLAIPASLTGDDSAWFDGSKSGLYPACAGPMTVAHNEIMVGRGKFYSTMPDNSGSIFCREGLNRSGGFIMQRPIRTQHLSFDGAAIFADLKGIERAAFLPGRFVSPFDESSHNYYHFIIEGLLGLHILRRFGVDAQPLFTGRNGQLAPWQAQYLAIMGETDVHVVDSDAADVVCVEELTWLRNREIHLLPNAFVQDFRRDLLAAAALPVPASSPERVFIRRARSRRGIENQEEVEAALVRLGFTVVMLETLSVAEQITLFFNARLVVGPHGAGLTNILFCQPGAAVIELVPSPDARNMFWLIANKAELRFSFLRCGSTGFDSDLMVDVAALETLIARAVA